MKNHFNKELVMTKKDDEDPLLRDKFVGDVKVRDIVISLENIEALDIEIVISTLNHKILIKLHNLENYDLYLIMQELDIFTFMINIIPNELKNIRALTSIISSFLLIVSNF